MLFTATPTKAIQVPMNTMTPGITPQQTIALVDDDRNILTSVAMALEAEGFKVKTYNDGEEGLQCITSSIPDLVVLDSAHRALAGLSAPQQLAGHVFASHRTSAVHSVWVGGVPRVTGARHADHAAAEAGWLAARQQLLAEQVPAAS